SLCASVAILFFFSSRRRHTRFSRDWSSDVCSSDLTRLPLELPMGKADNVILGIVHGLRQENPKREIVLVSKDINMRLKARALDLPAEDYLNDHVLDDSDLLYDGVMPLPENFWNKHGKDIESWQQNGLTWYRVRGPL